jgi:hypothetical protein
MFNVEKLWFLQSFRYASVSSNPDVKKFPFR